MLSLLGDSSVVENMDRFEAEYGPPEEDELKESPELAQRRRKVQESKGREWNNLFGDNVNSDDDFKLGISFFPKASKDTGTGSKSAVSVRLYTDFYKSDIILASPLALKIATESEEDKQDDTDFLSSIEICFLGYSDVILMQNWEHVNDVLGLLNQQPKGSNDTDFSRVREYLLAGQARYWRQLIFYSNLIDPSFLSTFKRHASCIEGIVRLRRRVYNNEAALVKVIVATKQIFQRVSCDSFSTQGDERLKYFQKKVLPQIQEGKRSFTMIYVPSYFEFISLRNLFLKKEMNFVSVTEYARVSEVSRGRARFLQGRKPIMLYTGRAHFFGRHLIKGAKHLIVYGLPEHAEFYSDVVNMLNLGHEGNDEQMGSSCLVLFTKYEAHSLERICGKQNCERMLKGEKSTFMFVS
jgi:U3 small nucleolar RNA-associated protein 25